MTLADLIALCLWLSLLLYALLGGADFGAGAWDLLARGERARRHQDLIEHAMAPVWEANHVWLILIVVLLFTAFPFAFSAMSMALHVPLTVLLVGIVLRGTAFTIRHYDPLRDSTHRLWSRVFGFASLVTPLCLGICLAAITSGWRTDEVGAPLSGFVQPWLGLFSLTTGLFTTALFAFLAAVYLAAEATEPELADDFRRRAILSEIVVGALAALTAFAARAEAKPFWHRFAHAPWTWPLQLATALAALFTLFFLYRRRYLAARAASIAQVTLILLGWGLGQYPFLVTPEISIASVAASNATLTPLAVALGAGAALLVPSLYYLIRVFKARPR